MASATPTLIAHDIWKVFGSGQNSSTVLRGVSMEAQRGEIVYLVGPSGSGKTTLLSVLGCILTPDKGEVEVLGRSIGPMTTQERTAFRRDNLGFIFQTFNLFPTLSAQDNIALSLTMRGVGLGSATRRAGELLNLVGLWHRRHARPAQMSGGECQRVAIARALADHPAIVFADEPTASLDAENGKAVITLLMKLVRDQGMTLVVVTHDNRIFPYADRILRLEDGLMVGESLGSENGSYSTPRGPLPAAPQRLLESV